MFFFNTITVGDAQSVTADVQLKIAGVRASITEASRKKRSTTTPNNNCNANTGEATSLTRNFDSTIKFNSWTVSNNGEFNNDDEITITVNSDNFLTTSEECVNLKIGEFGLSGTLDGQSYTAVLNLLDAENFSIIGGKTYPIDVSVNGMGGGAYSTDTDGEFVLSPSFTQLLPRNFGSVSGGQKLTISGKALGSSKVYIGMRGENATESTDGGKGRKRRQAEMLNLNEILSGGSKGLKPLTNESDYNNLVFITQEKTEEDEFENNFVLKYMSSEEILIPFTYASYSTPEISAASAYDTSSNVFSFNAVNVDALSASEISIKIVQTNSMDGRPMKPEGNSWHSLYSETFRKHFIYYQNGMKQHEAKAHCEAVHPRARQAEPETRQELKILQEVNILSGSGNNIFLPLNRESTRFWRWERTTEVMTEIEDYWCDGQPESGASDRPYVYLNYNTDKLTMNGGCLHDELYETSRHVICEIPVDVEIEHECVVSEFNNNVITCETNASLESGSYRVEATFEGYGNADSETLQISGVISNVVLADTISTLGLARMSFDFTGVCETCTVQAFISNKDGSSAASDDVFVNAVRDAGDSFYFDFPALNGAKTSGSNQHDGVYNVTIGNEYFRSEEVFQTTVTGNSFEFVCDGSVDNLKGGEAVAYTGWEMNCLTGDAKLELFGDDGVVVGTAEVNCEDKTILFPSLPEGTYSGYRVFATKTQAFLLL